MCLKLLPLTETCGYYTNHNHRSQWPLEYKYNLIATLPHPSPLLPPTEHARSMEYAFPLNSTKPQLPQLNVQNQELTGLDAKPVNAPLGMSFRRRSCSDASTTACRSPLCCPHTSCKLIRSSTSSSSLSTFSRASSSSHTTCTSLASTKTEPLSFSLASTTSTASVPLLPPYAPSPVLPPSPDDSKAILTLDGGGVRGIFAPLFLHALQRHLPPEVDVRSLLDLIGGTSTGGVAALMYARLGLSIEKVMDVYMKMPKRLFGSRRLKKAWWFFTNSQHSTNKQRKIYARAVKEATGDAAAPLKTRNQISSKSQCPVFVVAVDAADLSKPTIFSSYTPAFDTQSKEFIPSHELKDDASIVVAALATSAAPTYFHPTQHAGRTYIDGGIGYNNPSELALKQLTQLYGPSARAHTLISLGTGRRSANPYWLGAPRVRSGIAGMLDMLRAFAHISTDAESVHARLEERFAQTGGYFRFNPAGLEDVSLDDWTAVDHAVNASLVYLEQPETQRRLAELAARLLQARFPHL